MTKEKDTKTLACEYLYDAAYTMCVEYCIDEVTSKGIRFPTSEEILKNGCPNCDSDCRFLDWWQLLRKVRKESEVKSCS